MLDPLTAISLASAIVQFVDFGSKVIDGASEIYRSVDGALKENVDLEESTNKINQLNDKILLPKAASGDVISEDDTKLTELASTAKEVAGELLNLLQSFKSVRRSGYHKKWESFRKAVSVQTPWNKEKIQRLEPTDSERQSKMLSLLSRLADQQIDRWSSEILEAVNQQGKPKAFDMVTHKLTALVEKVYEAEISNLILTLDFANRTGREASIEEAYRTTFNWIFSEIGIAGTSSSRLSFKKWLESGRGVFWISGKAGSGKSTLMRYILNDPRTRRILRTWGDNQKLIIASYFFFNAGELLQKSQQGLIRSILTRPWKVRDLRDICKQLTQNALDIKFCLFVDGLDEYEGEHKDVIDILNDLTTLPNIKLCVSSRPWNVFQKCFGPMHQQLVLEKHTKNDIVLYVNERLGQDPLFASFARGDSRTEGLIENIIEIAQGVFLWVRLMVSDLLRGSANQDSISDLQRRLESLPPNLETYYQCAFDNIDQFYRETTAEILLLAQEASQPMSLLTIAYYEIEKQHHSDSRKACSDAASKAKVNTLLAACQTRLTSRCQDFLAVRSSPATGFTFKHTVEFLHATSAEFLRRPEMKSRLESWVSHGFNPRLTLLRAPLALAELEPSYQQFSPPAATFCTLVSQFLDYAYNMEKRDLACDAAIMDDFDCVAQQYYTSNFALHDGSLYSHWTIYWGTVQIQNPSLPHFWKNFLTTAIQDGLQLYVTKTLDTHRGMLHPSHGPPLLYYALAMLTPSAVRSRYGPRGSTAMVQLLLERGAQPHQHFCLAPSDQDMTVFGVFLGQLYAQKRRGYRVTHDIFEICLMLLGHASDPRLKTWNVPLLSSDGDGTVEIRRPIHVVLEDLFSPGQIAMLDKASTKGQLSTVLSWIYWFKNNALHHTIMVWLCVVIIGWLWVILFGPG